jgi:hypothetical protein
MQPKSEFQLPPRNPQTHAAHRRQTFWQITSPLLLALLFLLAAVGGVIWAGVGANPQVSRWADVSLIWLLLLPLALSLLVLALLGGLVYLTVVIIKALPGYASLVQGYFRLAAEKVSCFADRVTAPVIKLHEVQAQIKKMNEIAARELAKKSPAKQSAEDELQ